MIQPPAEDFFSACGTRAPLRLEIEHEVDHEIARQTLALPFALIGRDERADLRLEDKEVSHRHAYLQVVAGRLWCVDLGSRSGTQWETGGQFVGPLLSRHAIRIGPYTLRRIDESSPEENGSTRRSNPLTSESDDPALLPRLALEFRGGTMRHRTWLVDRVLTLIGRASFCKVRLHSSMVSRAHCALLNTPDGLWVVDLLGREGIYVNETAVRWARLEHEDELQIDQFRIRVRYLAPPPRSLEPSSLFNRDAERSAAVPALHSASRLNDPFSSVANSSPQALVALAPPHVMNGNESLLLPMIAQFSLMQQQMFDQFQQTLVLMAQMFGNLHREQMALVRQELDQIQDLTRQLQTLQSEGTRPTPVSPAESPPCPISSEPSTAVPNAAAPAAAPARCETDVHLWLSRRLSALQQERQSRWQRLFALLTGK